VLELKNDSTAKRVVTHIDTLELRRNKRKLINIIQSADTTGHVKPPLPPKIKSVEIHSEHTVIRATNIA